MDLRLHLENFLNGRVQDLKDDMKRTKAAGKYLSKIDLDDSRYVVYLNSLWEKEGEKSTVTPHTGTLESAIKEAKTEFRRTNNRSDVQANCVVQLMLDSNMYQVPKQFWFEYFTK